MHRLLFYPSWWRSVCCPRARTRASSSARKVTKYASCPSRVAWQALVTTALRAPRLRGALTTSVETTRMANATCEAFIRILPVPSRKPFPSPPPSANVGSRTRRHGAPIPPSASNGASHHCTARPSSFANDMLVASTSERKRHVHGGGGGGGTANSAGGGGSSWYNTSLVSSVSNTVQSSRVNGRVTIVYN